MKRYKKILPIIIGVIIGISTTVGAATIFNSKDITYSSSATTKTNVKDVLDELYAKVNTPWKCADGWYCYTSSKPLSLVEVGDWIKMTPTSKNYIISKSLTGDSKDQTINPSELKLWRVIKKNDDGSIEVVSHYASRERIFISGRTGYMNLVKILNTVAAQYTNSKYVSKTRHTGYNGQKEQCSTISESGCGTENGFENDLNLITNAIGFYGTLDFGSAVNSVFWLPSRIFYNDGNLLVNMVYTDGDDTRIEGSYLYGNYADGGGAGSIRPILTIKKGSEITGGGDGKSAETAYQLE